MQPKSLIIVASILVGFGVAIYFMNSPTSKSDAITWLITLAVVALIGFTIGYIRKKRGSE